MEGWRCGWRDLKGGGVRAMVSDKKQGKSNRRPTLKVRRFFLPSQRFHSPFFPVLFYSRATPSCLHPPSTPPLSPICSVLLSGYSLWNSSPLSPLVSGKLITLLTLLDFLRTVHLALFLGAATATNSLLIYVMTAERQTVLSAADWRGWGKRHARKHNTQRYHIAGKVTVKIK